MVQKKARKQTTNTHARTQRDTNAVKTGVVHSLPHLYVIIFHLYLANGGPYGSYMLLELKNGKVIPNFAYFYDIFHSIFYNIFFMIFFS